MTLLVGPTVHSPLIDVLIRFRQLHSLVMLAKCIVLFCLMNLTKTWRAHLEDEIKD